MKKLVLGFMSLVLCAFSAGSIKAAGSDKIDTPNTKDTASGVINGEVAYNAIGQMVVTVPLKIDFVITNVATESGIVNNIALTPTTSKITVGNGTDVTLDKINVTMSSPWNLISSADTATSTAAHAISLNMFTKPITSGGDVTIGTDIAKNTDLSLGLTINPAQKWAFSANTASAKAIEVVYSFSKKV